ncbi:MBL fold metallo-hydrolase [Caldimonas tepidiphila]|uniref:MBL fold metallo-hydrolase n=1 Tax=Caldimonas tepidiphila TaxID=2315841 RepID=UPI000E5B2BF4|nr:3',5'-cyclic-nucleotide phosphodiesterase [Caldimonas tepidiphila]
MNVRVLGCSGAIAAGSKTTSFLVDEDLLVDAGTGVGDLTLEELERIDHILLSHSHLDHVLSIPLMADSVISRRKQPIVVHGLPETLAALRAHVFNNVIWPDFTRLPSSERPVLRFEPLRVGQRLRLGNHEIEVLPAEHTVPAVGYAVRQAREDAPWWVYTGDTGPNPALWPLLAGRRIGALVIETAFSDREQELARLSRHLSPCTLAQGLGELPPGVPVFITHTKPDEMASVAAEVRALRLDHAIGHLQAGQVLPL